jgi:hypothetical protein
LTCASTSGICAGTGFGAAGAFCAAACGVVSGVVAAAASVEDLEHPQTTSATISGKILMGEILAERVL